MSPQDRPAFAEAYRRLCHSHGRRMNETQLDEWWRKLTDAELVDVLQTFDRVDKELSSFPRFSHLNQTIRQVERDRLLRDQHGWAVVAAEASGEYSCAHCLDTGWRCTDGQGRDLPYGTKASNGRFYSRACECRPWNPEYRRKRLSTHLAAPRSGSTERKEPSSTVIFR